MARGVIQPVVGMRTHFTEVETIFDSIVEEKLLRAGCVDVRLTRAVPSLARRTLTDDFSST